MESHPSLEELMARPAIARRQWPWKLFGITLFIVAQVLFWGISPRFPVEVVMWWPLLWVVLIVVEVVILRQLERVYWLLPWAWRKE